MESYINSFIENMSIRGFTPNTQKTYLRYLTSFLSFIQKEPLILTSEDARTFLIHLKNDKKASSASINGHNTVNRFFYEYTLNQLWDTKRVPRMKNDSKLPIVLTREEVAHFISSYSNIKHKAIVSTLYSSGLRVSELCNLTYDDIFRSKMQIHIRSSKSRYDRYAILSKTNLDILTQYWKECNRPMEWLFPGHMKGSHISKGGCELIVKNQAKKLGYKIQITPHTFRHSFATHLLEDGVSLPVIQQLLGHRTPQSTNVYLHLTSKTLMNIKSPLDRIKI
jgi:site-specific recombinase XerD